MTQIEQPVLQGGDFSSVALAACLAALLPEEPSSTEEGSTSGCGEVGKGEASLMLLNCPGLQPPASPDSLR